MAYADYCLCDLCGGKAFYDANISDTRYTATYDPTEDCDPIGIAVLCAECNKTHEAVIKPRSAQPAAPETREAGVSAKLPGGDA